MAQKKDFDEMFKTLLIGDSAVGKSSLLMRFTEDTFTPNFISTIGAPLARHLARVVENSIDFKAKTIEVNGKRIKLQVWDTAGQERFRTITTAYFRSAVGILLVYDVTSIDSFQNLGQWVKSIDMHASDDVVRVLVGNKADMVDKRAVPKSRGEELAREYGISFCETSAKTGANVQTLFQALTEDILAQQNGAPAKKGDRDTVQLSQGDVKKKEEGCCK